MITRYNYEEYFLMYVDNELSAAEKNAVEEFVQQNPDLEEELNMLKQSVIKPESNIVFNNKNLLLKQTEENSFINLNNYEEYFLLYVDNELNTPTKKQVEEFVSKNPSLQNEFYLLQQTKSEADESIVFEGKESLYKKEERRRFIPFAWIASAAAVAILLVTGFLLYNKEDISKRTSDRTIVKKNEAEKSNSATDIIKDNKKETLPVTSSINDSLNISKLAEVKTTNRRNEEKKSPNEIASNKNRSRKEDRKKSEDINVVEPIDEPDAVNKASVAKIYNTIIDPKIENATTGTSEIAPKQLVVIVDKPADLPNDKNTKSSIAILTASGDETTNDDSEKKNKLRGIFRRVSRVFNKSNDDENSKRSVSIGSFQIALR